jgi:hypothetical protein
MYISKPSSPVNPGRSAGHLPVRKPVIPDGCEIGPGQFLKRRESPRALDGQLSIVVAHEFHARIEPIRRADMRKILFLVGCVDAEEIMILRHFVNQDIVYYPAVRVQQRRVLRLAHFEFAGMIRSHEIGQGAGVGPVDFDLSHVADIEQPHRRAYRVMFFDDAGILDGHLPPAEIHQLGPQGPVYGIQRRGAKRGCCGHELSG